MKDIKIISAIGILFLGFVIFLLWPDEEKIIQTAPLVVLVFVTLYYSIETYRIVKEGRIKRIADFYEKRINEFYAPFMLKLNDLRDELYKNPSSVEDIKVHTEKMNALLRDAQYHLWQKGYMVSKKTKKKINDLQLDLLEAEVDREKESSKKFRDSNLEVTDIILKEWRFVEEEIRKIYGYSEAELCENKETKKI